MGGPAKNSIRFSFVLVLMFRAGAVAQAVADFNQDGRLDIALARHGTNHILTVFWAR
jgi:hypothetical protein